MISWQYFPKSDKIPSHLQKTIEVFTKNISQCHSVDFQLGSDEVLVIMRNDLEKLGYTVEKGKKGTDKIKVPVLFGLNGSLEKSFDADAFDLTTKTVLEVEAGRAVTNYQFLKDLFQACMMHEVSYLVIAVRKTYRGNPDFQKVITFFETLYASGRLNLPLSGILVIGY
jgi:hypothetical protein